MSEETRLCTNCRWACRKDYGWSNYTVEGTVHSCLLEEQEEFDHDEYDEAKLREWAKGAASCPSFEYGDGVDLDCDLEEVRWAQRDSDEDDYSAYTNDSAVLSILAKGRRA